jgi:ATP-dependent helicase/nuclease subunit B
LYVSWPLHDEENKPLLPSPLIRRLCALFPALPVQRQGDPDLAHLVGGELDLSLAAVRLRQAAAGAEIAPLWPAVYAYYAGREEWQGQLSRAEQGFSWQPGRARLSRRLLGRMYGQRLRSSVSRLEKYRMCPFSYYAAYGLKLRERRLYRLTPADRGDLFHYVLAEVGQRITAGGGWQQVDQQLAEELVEQALITYLPRFLSGILQSSARYAYLQGRMREALVAAVMLTAEHMRGGQFVPVAYEFAFGDGAQADAWSAPAWRIPLDDQRELLLSGKIDRIDMATLGGEAAYFRVIDYKTGSVSLKREDIAAGLRLQLLVYLQVVLANSAQFSALPPRPAGMFYAPLHDDLQLSVPDEETAPAGLKLAGLAVADAEAVDLADPGLSGYSQLLPVGYNAKTNSFYQRPAALSGQELDAMRQQLTATLQDTATAMLAGMVEVSPLIDGNIDACAYCDHRAVCGFDRFFVPPRRKPQAETEAEDGDL